MFLAPAFLIGLIKFGESLALMNCPDLVGAREKPSFGKKAELWEKYFAIVGMLLISFNLYLTKSYGAWLAIGLVLMIVFWLKYRKLWPIKYLAITIIILIIFIAAASFGKFENIKKLGERSSLASREMIWKSAGLMIEKNPVLGIGPGNFQEKYLEYQKYFPPYLEWAVPQPHNLYLAFWLESGLAGLAGFFWVVWLFFKDNKKIYPLTKISEHHNALVHKTKKQTQESPSEKNNFGEGARDFYGSIFLAIILYFLIHGLVDTTYWRNDMAVIFWTIVAVNLFLAEKRLEKN
ncbi:MAG: hypothetical protein A2184_00580 [Candidatus Moranbacteria bacterium RIFOXYA1_FULL_44_7]|nr:MAG: hypothetical protein A2184_00580 [Candidatus Moranbacteria bacterium RIFOXYA1_FULL_44_7]